MSQNADIGSKRLISLAPDAWVQWVTRSTDVTAQEIVEAEFQWVSRMQRKYPPLLNNLAFIISAH